MKKIFEQPELWKILEPLIESRARFFKKFRPVRVRPAVENERIVTVTADGKETENRAAKGDFVLQNSTEAAEQYIISAAKMAERYRFVENLASDWAGWQLHEPVGETRALELEADFLEALKLPATFHFVAPWGEKMVAKKGDFLAINTNQTVYRIARKEFFETYRAVD